MTERDELIQVSQLFERLAWAGAEKAWNWGTAYVMTTADILRQVEAVDPVNRLPWKDVAGKFVEAVDEGQIALMGDRGLLRHIGSEDVASMAFAVQYVPSDQAPEKDLVVCVVNRRAEELTAALGGHSISDVVDTIADAIHTLSCTPDEKRIKTSDVDPNYFPQTGLVL